MHCCDVLSIDYMILMGKYEGTMLNAIGIDADCQLESLAFAIMEKESTDNWGRFFCLVRKVVVGPGREICVILDKHARILNAVCKVIPNHIHVHHWWCI
jgi:transposase-like protein